MQLIARTGRWVSVFLVIAAIAATGVSAAPLSRSAGLTASVVITVLTPPTALEGANDLGIAPQTGQLAFTVTRNEDGTVTASDQSTFQLPISFSYQKKKNVSMLLSARWRDPNISSVIPLQLYVDTGQLASEQTPTDVAQNNFRCRGADDACVLPAVPESSPSTPLAFYQNDAADYDSASISNAVFHLGFLVDQGGGSATDSLLTQTFEEGRTYVLELTFTVGAQS